MPITKNNPDAAHPPAKAIRTDIDVASRTMQSLAEHAVPTKLDQFGMYLVVYISVI
jgi:hypothetical protein